jgi:hypothetical protein
MSAATAAEWNTLVVQMLVLATLTPTLDATTVLASTKLVQVARALLLATTMRLRPSMMVHAMSLTLAEFVTVTKRVLVPSTNVVAPTSLLENVTATALYWMSVATVVEPITRDAPMRLHATLTPTLDATTVLAISVVSTVLTSSVVTHFSLPLHVKVLANS